MRSMRSRVLSVLPDVQVQSSKSSRSQNIYYHVASRTARPSGSSRCGAACRNYFSSISTTTACTVSFWTFMYIYCIHKYILNFHFAYQCSELEYEKLTIFKLLMSRNPSRIRPFVQVLPGRTAKIKCPGCSESFEEGASLFRYSHRQMQIFVIDSFKFVDMIDW